MLSRPVLWRASVLFLILSATTGSVLAVDPNQREAGYIQTSFTVEDGLSSKVVNAILQTRNGFLRLGTDAGLDRFNGRRFTPIYFRGARSTPQGIVRSLAEGPDGDLWIGTSAGLARIAGAARTHLDRSQAVFYHPGPGYSDDISRLAFGCDGTLWVGTFRRALSVP